MIDFFQRSLYRKLLLAFILVGVFPYLIFFIYTIYFSEQKIVKKIIDEQHIQAKMITDTIDNHLTLLNKEIKFISALDLMDDIVAEDIDKRISRLLMQKKDDIALDVELFAIGENSQIISSSNSENISKKFPYEKNFSSDQNYFIVDKDLFIFSKIVASFDPDKKLGYLILKYNLENLKTFFVTQEGVHNQILNHSKEIKIGEKMSFEVNLQMSHQIEKDYLIINNNMLHMMEDFHIIYMIEKDLALEFLYDFIYFMILMIPVALAVTILIAHYSTKSILKPISILTDTTEMITKSRNFNVLVKNIDTKDEIGRLKRAFNEMISTTHNALESLEIENKLRLKRFVDLIEIFNKIIQTKNEEECIENSLLEFETLTNKKLTFTHDKIDCDQCLNIYLNDFEKDEKSYFGSIELNMIELTDENERKFYSSIAAMITLQLERIRLIERTMSASRAKSAFISNMSHELRTPLNAIIGFTQYLIAYEELEEEQEDIISNIESSAHYLLSMINEILDIAKIEAGKMEAHFEQMQIKSELESVIMMTSTLAKDKNLELSLDYDQLDIDQIESDPKLFKQIVINLISNAIKFTETGEIKVNVKNEKDQIVISVKDSGIGISPENMKMLFSDFTQVENVIQKRHKGTGLGLSLSRKLSHLLHGNLELKSDGEGKGSEAVFTLTLESLLS